MKLFFHYCVPGFSNCYVLGTEESRGEAIVVDPGGMENGILESIETNDYKLRAVLVTHEHKRHIHGLRTLRRIYQVEVFAINSIIQDCITTQVKDGDRISIGPFQVEVISIPGHSSDSVVYRIDRLLFTGDALTAGLVGPTASAYSAATQMNRLRNRLLSLPGDYTVLPGHGPPSTLEAERSFNIGISQYKEVHARKPVFRIDL
ncbi:MAG: MBL fold metallo-hydrolase [Treponema sp.]|nr:MBL fold metallo-hydrolase [Treponema sp.]MCL2191290.1 MBL fold metallo-hydrolase [Treponema sp.]